MDIRKVHHIFAQALDIRVEALRILSFSLNRHLPEKDWVEPHEHAHSQFLLYLTGHGNQRVGSLEHEVRPGVLFFLPPASNHAFIEGDGRRPLCLALDLELPAASLPAQPVRAMLAQSDLQLIRQALSMLHTWQPGNESIRPRQAGAVLQILDVLMRATGLLENASSHSTLPVVRRVREVFREGRSSTAPVAEAAELVGYHRDHLTRILRRETGMSAGQLRAGESLKKAQTYLAGTDPIAVVAEKTGFSDPNYFTRWFRRQTGSTPSAWRAGKR